MNLMTKFEIGDIVNLVLDEPMGRKLQIIEINIYMDGGYKYYCKWIEGDQGLVGMAFFEGELKKEGGDDATDSR